MSYNELHDLHHSNTMLTCIKGPVTAAPQLHAPCRRLFSGTVSPVLFRFF